MFTGLNAFPLTPLAHDEVDEAAFVGLIKRLASAKVDAITALGSTGSYAYLTAEERARVARLAVEHAGDVPVVVGVGALRTSHVLEHTRNAEQAGARAILLAPMTYQPLTPDDVFALFRTVADATDLPIIVYDNPGTTHFTFTPELYGRIAELPGIASIKIPPVSTDPAEAAAAVAAIRAVIPDRVTIGISGDAAAASGLIAGCDAWYSVIGGTLPEPALAITRAVTQGNHDEALRISEQLDPLWSLFREHGSLRVIAAVAEHLGFVGDRNLPLPIQGLSEADRARVAELVGELGLR